MDVAAGGLLPVAFLSSSVAPMPINVMVRLADAGNATVASGSDDATARVLAVAADPGCEFLGVPIAEASRGVANFTRLALKAAPGTYNITFGEMCVTVPVRTWVG